ncbi:MAG: VWA domain-containing protein [Candidatus Kapabacteria bacterium]|nr:VWA domain-containing protein [Candidatus Kapabacteria bacterium]
MESLRLDLAGGPWYVYLGLALLSVVLSAYLYRVTVPPVDKGMRGVLIALRSIGLLALILVLFEPLARFLRSETTQPRIAIAIDGSRSMAMRDRSRNRANDVRSASATLRSLLGDDADVYVFDESMRTLVGSTDTMRLGGYRTDVGTAIRAIANAQEEVEYGAVVVVSDGNHNTGEQPLYSAERSGLAVYTLGIGDSVPPTDVRMAAVTAPGVGVVNEPVAVTLDIEQANIDDRTATVVVADNGTAVARLPLELRRGVSRYQITHRWTPTSDGLHVISASIEGAGDEFTLKNNASQATVRVRKNKKRVVLFAGAPSPDVAFIRSAVTQDPTLELVTFIHREGTTFYEGTPNAASLADATAIIMVGFPTANTPKSVVDDIAARCRRGASLLFVASPATDYTKLVGLSEVLPFRVSSNRPIEMTVTTDVPAVATADPLMRLTGAENDADVWNSLPPIYRTELFAEPAPGAIVLSRIKVGTMAIDEPLIIKRDLGQTRSLAILGHGIYRWKLLGQGPATSRGAAGIDVLQTFASNSIKWLSVRDDERRVQIRSTHEAYVVGEQIAFSASVMDQSFTPVDDAQVRVVIEGGQQPRTIELAAEGSGRYSARIGSLPPGRYNYSGVAMSKGATIGRDQGTFVVSDIGLEEQTTTMNASLLRTLAQRTGGRFATIDSIDALVNALRRDPRLRPVVRTSERELALHHLPWIVAIAISAFAIEWFLRKRKGLV